MNTTLPNNLSIRDTAKHLKVGEKKVRMWMRQGRLKAMNLGTKTRPLYRFTVAAIQAFEKTMEVPVAVKRKKEKLDPEIEEWLR